ncbi:MAG: proline--tRNA ligase [Dehalococcoidia bacterium]|nr:proline--tRNA ligase [Dehalococcoidia bacterium]
MNKVVATAVRFSQLFGKTMRQAPAGADTAAHQLMLRAGMINQLAAGTYTILPFGLHAYQNVERIIREEMAAGGAQEILMPALQPIELWEQSGRKDAFGPTLFQVKDRKDRMLALGPTHEEVVTTLVGQTIQSYRDLPLILYQIQTKFRDEARPRAGLVRVREFAMKDAYSFDQNEAGLEDSYDRMYKAYANIYKRCGVPAIPVDADSGAIGGKASVEWILKSDTGEDEVIKCPSCAYAANAEKASGTVPQRVKEDEKPTEEVATPGKSTIIDVSAFLKIEYSQTLKAVFYSADKQVIFVIIRGDLDVNEIKLKNLLKATELRIANDQEVARAGLVPGYASPIGVSGVKIIADESIKMGSNFVTGANKVGFHIKNVNYPRDFKADAVTDIAKISAGHGCPKCGAKLESFRGVEVGHLFKLGTVYSQKMGAFFLDKDGARVPALMGCYGIGVGRLLAMVVEQNRDEKGIIWPKEVAPFDVHLVALNIEQEPVRQAAEKLLSELQGAGLSVLYDDRSETPGVKFNDADLLGLPIRVTVSPRTLQKSSAELKLRTESQNRLVGLGEALASIKGS